MGRRSCSILLKDRKIEAIHGLPEQQEKHQRQLSAITTNITSPPSLPMVSKYNFGYLLTDLAFFFVKLLQTRQILKCISQASITL